MPTRSTYASDSYEEDEVPFGFGSYRFNRDDLYKHSFDTDDGSTKKFLLANFDPEQAENVPQEIILVVDHLYRKLGHVEGKNLDFLQMVANCFEGGAHDHWMDIMNGIDLNALDDMVFEQMLKEMVAHYVQPDHRENQIEWMLDHELSKKPFDMLVQTYKERMERNKRLMEQWMPGDRTYDDQDLKTTFFKGMPQSWQDKFQLIEGSYTQDDNPMDYMAKRFRDYERQTLNARLRERKRQLNEARSSNKRRHIEGRAEHKSDRDKAARSRKPAPDSRRHTKEEAIKALNWCRHQKCKAEGMVRHLWDDCPHNHNNQDDSNKASRGTSRRSRDHDRSTRTDHEGRNDRKAEENYALDEYSSDDSRKPPAKRRNNNRKRETLDSDTSDLEAHHLDNLGYESDKDHSGWANRRHH